MESSTAAPKKLGCQVYQNKIILVQHTRVKFWFVGQYVLDTRILVMTGHYSSLRYECNLIASLVSQRFYILVNGYYYKHTYCIDLYKFLIFKITGYDPNFNSSIALFWSSDFRPDLFLPAKPKSIWSSLIRKLRIIDCSKQKKPNK